MTFQNTTPESVDFLRALEKARAAEQALATTELAARRKVEQARLQRDQHADSQWDWSIGVEDAEATLTSVRAQLADVRALLEQLSEVAPRAPLSSELRRTKPPRDRLVTGAFLSAAAVLLLTGAALIYNVTGGNAFGGTASGAGGTPVNTAQSRPQVDGEQRPVSIRLMTDGDPLSAGPYMTRDQVGEAQLLDPRGLQSGSPADQDEPAPTPTPQPTPDAPETLDDFAAEASPTATPQPPAPASDDFTSEPEPTATPEPPTAADELAAEPEPTATPAPPATTNDMVAQPEPSPTPVPPAPSDELSAEPTATPEPVVSDSVTLATADPDSGVTDTTIVAPIEP